MPPRLHGQWRVLCRYRVSAGRLSMTVISIPSNPSSHRQTQTQTRQSQRRASCRRGRQSFFSFLLLLIWGSASQSHAIRRQGDAMQHRPRRGTAEKRLRMDAYRGQLVACLLHLRLPSSAVRQILRGGFKTDQTLVRVLGTCTWHAQRLRC